MRLSEISGQKMLKFYVNLNAQLNGDHEVHHEYCIYLPTSLNRKLLGDFQTCREATKQAKLEYSLANGCKTCSRDCHTR